ncbi:MAG: glutamate formiminotransferase, partial [Caldilineaceae bacterium]|nr:glutamate formiminotransferase [Caldilineaceae bacterium]
VLVAFNIFLDSGDVAIAKWIARRVRASSGGLPAVKALGLLVDGQAQVSLNLVDLDQTSIHTVVETIDKLAQEMGTTIDHSELIGLVPEAAILQAAAYALRLPNLERSRLIERATDDAITE